MSETQGNPSNIDLSIVKPYTPTEAQVKRYTSRKIASAWTLFGGSLAVLAIVIVCIILFKSSGGVDRIGEAGPLEPVSRAFRGTGIT